MLGKGERIKVTLNATPHGLFKEILLSDNWSFGDPISSGRCSEEEDGCDNLLVNGRYLVKNGNGILKILPDDYSNTIPEFGHLTNPSLRQRVS
jgi:hypothetical protein